MTNVRPAPVPLSPPTSTTTRKRHATPPSGVFEQQVVLRRPGGPAIAHGGCYRDPDPPRSTCAASYDARQADYAHIQEELVDGCDFGFILIYAASSYSDADLASRDGRSGGTGRVRRGTQHEFVCGAVDVVVVGRHDGVAAAASLSPQGVPDRSSACARGAVAAALTADLPPSAVPYGDFLVPDADGVLCAAESDREPGAVRARVGVRGVQVRGEEAGRDPAGDQRGDAVERGGRDGAVPGGAAGVHDGGAASERGWVPGVSGERGDGAGVRGRAEPVRGGLGASGARCRGEGGLSRPAAGRADASALVWAEPRRFVVAERAGDGPGEHDQVARFWAVGRGGFGICVAG